METILVWAFADDRGDKKAHLLKLKDEIHNISEKKRDKLSLFATIVQRKRIMVESVSEKKWDLQCTSFVPACLALQVFVASN